MRDRNECDLGLLTQIEAEPQGTMRREVTNKNIRQRAVVVFLVGGALTFPIPLLHRLTVPIFGITGHGGPAHLLGLGPGLFVLRPDEAALDPDHAVMIEDHEGPAARDVIRIIGVPLGFQPIDLSLKLA
jgi:hypothetical protein